MKIYIHERSNEDGCQFGWTEGDTMAPHQVRHECEKAAGHADYRFLPRHVCSCGLIEDET
jgi:hypothetical protein